MSPSPLVSPRVPRGPRRITNYTRVIRVGQVADRKPSIIR
ncbi:hypothetical protein MICRO8M_100320 [Microbacterium sp. 8M]|nr:hypothetical protein MICRO8M_100320 [Microbacterium sp. 8M]